MGKTFWITETYVNETGDHIVGESPIYDTGETDKGKVFRTLQKEHGRCAGRVYLDTPEQEAIPIGWTFQKKVPYTDTGELYLQMVWANLFDGPPSVKRTYHYRNMETGDTVDVVRETRKEDV
jgi:hypothetical protein